MIENCFFIIFIFLNKFSIPQ
ncbi:CPXV078A protein [Cowpox virus]|uniref:CPXV078A protein n=1 Tax=Cowpox virus TaxID=10243 RepID=U5TB97_COWPX|nr:CPXV078A protein [Cowpox virus]